MFVAKPRKESLLGIRASDLKLVAKTLALVFPFIEGASSAVPSLMQPLDESFSSSWVSLVLPIAEAAASILLLLRNSLGVEPAAVKSMALLARLEPPGFTTMRFWAECRLADWLGRAGSLEKVVTFVKTITHVSSPALLSLDTLTRKRSYISVALID